MGTSSSLICGDVDTIGGPTPEVQDLTKEEVNMILRSWKIPSQKLIDTGEAILLKFLEKNPQSQKKFFAFRNIPLIQLRGAPGFRTHASRVMNEFSTSIDCLDKENGLAAIAVSWTEVGRSHLKRKITRTEFLKIREVIIEVLTDISNLNEDEQKAWSKLLETIYHFLFIGLTRQTNGY